MDNATRLYLFPGTQLARLPQNRLLVRHKFGVGILNGLSLEDLRELLSSFTGVPLDQVLEKSTFEPEDIMAVIQRLRGPVIMDQPPTMQPAGIPSASRQADPGLVVFGNGESGRAFSQRITSSAYLDLNEFSQPEPVSCQGYCDFLPPATIAKLNRARLKQAIKPYTHVLCVLEGVSWRVWKEVQKTTLETGIAFLPLRNEPDGWRLGPTNLPGRSACLDCGLRTQMRFLGPWLPMLDSLRTLAAGQPPEDLVGECLRELELLQKSEMPLLTDKLVHSGHRGGQLKIAWESDCPTCGGFHSGIKITTHEPHRADLLSLSQIRRFEQDRNPSQNRQNIPKSIGILGGGTAGYLAALAIRRQFPQIRLTLIESSKVPIIGVGEATTPLMPQFLHADLGLDIHDFFKQVQPTFKLGIRFLWGREKDSRFNYPFGPIHPLEALSYNQNILNYSFQSMAMNREKLPLDASGLLMLNTETAYHLENRRFVGWLHEKAIRAGVQLLDTTIARIEKSPENGSLSALVDEHGRSHSFDIYVDCSGFKSMLLGEALGSAFVDYKSSLFTDRALIAAVPHKGDPKPYTLAETMSAGWCWNTPQVEEDHRGYVFSSAFIDEDRALAEMRMANPGMGPARIIQFRAGRHQHFWKGNVFALGNAYGFVEPLESTALHMLIRQIGLLLKSLTAGPKDHGLQEMLNKKVAGWWDYLAWFLTLHYKFNHRINSEFWRTCRQEVDISAHEELVRSYKERGPLSADPALRGLFDYPDPLWGPEGIDTMLAGQQIGGHLPGPARSRGAWQQHLNQCNYLLDRALPQNEGLALLQNRPELLEELAAVFRRRGAAFIQ